MLIEENTNYAYKLKYLDNPTFDKVRDLAISFYRELPQKLSDELYEALNRGVDLLYSEPLMVAYLYAFGRMHQAKLNYAYGKLPSLFLGQPEINIIDYGCGQAIGTICYADFLRGKGYSPKVKTITLIEPSEICLKRAALHASLFYPNAEIKTINKKFDDLTLDDISCSDKTATLHVLSNVLDMLCFDLPKFSNMIKGNLNGYNQFVCVGPYFKDYQRDKRMKEFSACLCDGAYYEIKDKREFYLDKDWTCTLSLFSVGQPMVFSNDITDDSIAKQYTELAETGDAVAQYKLGRYYCEQKNDRNKACFYFQSSANHNNIEAITCLGCCYRHGYGVKKDVSKAFHLTQHAACLGYPRAQRSMAFFFEDGICVKQDYAKAIEWFEKAANNGDTKSLFELGDWYAKGKGVQRDYEKAAEYLIKAAEQDHSGAQFMLGSFFENGKGVEKDYASALKWYIKAAEQGEEKAQHCLGNLYLMGKGVQQDSVTAFKWYKKAAEQGFSISCNALGLCYECGYGIEIDYAKAVLWYTKAAEQGFVYSQDNLGKCYTYGKGVQKDPAKAVFWFAKAAEKGLAGAQCNLGVCYENGNGVQQNYERAVYWFRKAAEQGFADAQCYLGYCCERGLGTEKDYVKAIEWYEKAAVQGIGTAQLHLGICYELGLGTEKDYVKAVGWYKKAAEQGIASAQLKLGVCYQNGKGVSKDLDVAIEWYEKAAKHDNLDALIRFRSAKNVRDRHLKGKVVYEDLKDAYEDEYSVLYSNDGLRLLKTTRKDIKGCVVNKGTKTICEKAFSGCRYLQSISIPESINIIGEKAFERCQSLQQVNFSNSVARIGNDAFSGCKSLEQIYVPKGSIGRFKDVLDEQLWDKLTEK